MSEWRDVRVPATIRGYTDRPQGTVRARRSLGPPDRPVRPARSRLGSLRASRRPLRSHVPNRSSEHRAMLPACTTAWRLRGEPQTAHGFRSHICSWPDPQKPPKTRIRRCFVRYRTSLMLLRPRRTGSVRMNYSQDAADTTYLSAWDPL